MSFNGENSTWRSSDQEVLPLKKEPAGNYVYDIYPTIKIGDNLIYSGYESIAEIIRDHKTVFIECYSGAFVESFAGTLSDILEEKGRSVKVVPASAFMKPPGEIEKITAPFMGDGDPLFGTRTSLTLIDYFIRQKLSEFRTDDNFDINIIAGPGASLVRREGLLLYIDIPKNEIQYRSRAGTVSNLGMSSPAEPGEMYKRFYFVDWIILNRHKKELIPSIDIFIDGQRPDIPAWMTGSVFREALAKISRAPFRVRPWFEPGVWGGTWIRERIHGLNKKVPNYAWSFELISPENGLILESSALMMEISFDCLMFREAASVLGDCYYKYGTEFPIRFDFLDTVDGDNLSLQCHPRPDYIKDNFGESFTQEESYYILDSRADSSVYLGFRDDIDPAEFRRSLEESFSEQKAIDPEKYVLKHPSKKHDLFLIPYGTIHGSAKNNMVLEISTTPYIFTFKLYDWIRPDMNGKLRPLNISRGFENLFFDRKGQSVRDSLISKPMLIEEGPGWKLFDLPTHETHSYAIQRYQFTSGIEIRTNNKCLVLNLVEGTGVSVEYGDGLCQKFSYAETFIIPAAAGSVRIVSTPGSESVLIKAFIK